MGTRQASKFSGLAQKLAKIVKGGGVYVDYVNKLFFMKKIVRGRKRVIEKSSDAVVGVVGGWGAQKMQRAGR